MVLNPDRKIPPKVKHTKPENKFGLVEKVIIPIKNPMHPVKNNIESFFWGEIFAIINEPINAPRPSEEVKIPISTHLNLNYFYHKLEPEKLKETQRY